MNQEETNQVEMLAVFHYVVGGLLALFACLPFLHVFMGLAMISGKFFEDGKGGAQPPELFGWLFVIMGSVFILMGWLIAIGILIAGKKLKRRESRIFCMVVAGIECMFMPFGTVLGVFTLIVLNKESVKQAFLPSLSMSESKRPLSPIGSSSPVETSRIDTKKLS